MRKLRPAPKSSSKASQKRDGSSVKTSTSNIDLLRATLIACIALSKELVALHPDVIIGHSTPVVAALLKATHTIPIVFVVVADPVGSGFVASLARPGGNVTGFTNLLPTITGKYLSILRDLEPQSGPRGLMYNPESVH